MLNSVWRGYKYAFFHFFNYGFKKWGVGSYPQYWAAYVLAIFATLNVYTILTSLELLSRIPVYTKYVINDKGPRTVGVLLIFLIHYFLFVSNQRYQAIFKEFEHEVEKNRKRAVYLGIYTLVSVAGVLVTTWLFIVSPT